MTRLLLACALSGAISAVLGVQRERRYWLARRARFLSSHRRCELNLNSYTVGDQTLIAWLPHEQYGEMMLSTRP